MSLSARYTGLFAKGAQVNAIVRLSTGTENSEYVAGKTRVFGMGIKLFPTQDPSEVVTTKNIFTLDNFSVDGSARPDFLIPGPGEDLYFTNHAPAQGLLLKFINLALFRRFDRQPAVRTVRPLSEVDQTGGAVATAAFPEEIRFIPRILR